jgi:hypothetical protein
MSDLVTKLRTRNGRPDGFGLGPVCDAAADLIEQQAAELAALRQDAERYRYYRARAYKDGSTLALDVGDIDDTAIGDFGEFIDATADAALAGTAGEGGEMSPEKLIELENMLQQAAKSLRCAWRLMKKGGAELGAKELADTVLDVEEVAGAVEWLIKNHAGEGDAK